VFVLTVLRLKHNAAAASLEKENCSNCEKRHPTRERMLKFTLMKSLVSGSNWAESERMCVIWSAVVTLIFVKDQRCQ
jgi:ribosomal protein S26